MPSLPETSPPRLQLLILLLVFVPQTRVATGEIDAGAVDVGLLDLRRDFERVAGVEVSETSCEWARKNAAANSIGNAEFLTASAEAIFDRISFPAAETAVVIDPPRKGCTPEFIEQLVKFGPSRIVYVSCDPATQVRDLKLLGGGGYQLADVQPFDLFPHTRHLECVMTLVKAAPPDAG